MKCLSFKRFQHLGKKKNINKLRVYFKNLEMGGQNPEEKKNEEDKTRNMWITKNDKIVQ